MNRAAKHSQQGFTIVELLLAMAFVAMLLLAIAITVIQIGNVYNKGLTMRSVDQAGRIITADLRRVIGQGQPFSVVDRFVTQRHPQTEQGESDGGRLCTGLYTYIWNFGRILADEAPINVYDTGDEMIRLVRIRDSGGVYCLAANINQPIIKANATELLAEGDGNLAIQSFTMEELVRDPNVGQALYRIVLEIGTNDQDALDQESGTDSQTSLTTIDTSCKPPNDDFSQQTFCAVNQFDFTVQAGNKGGL